MIKKITTMAVLAALVMALTATVAFAAGQGKPEDVPRGQAEMGPQHANSECSYSGLNDDPTDPMDPGQVQSHGQIVKQGYIKPGEDPGRAVPGFACNGSISPLQEGR